MGKLLWIAGAVLVLCVGEARAADDAVVARVEALLAAGIEPAGAHDAIASLGPSAEDALWTLYGRVGTPRIVRLRALSELSRFATPRTAQGFAQLVRAASVAEPPADVLHPARSPVALRRALDGLSALTSVPRPITPEDLTFALAHGDPHVRRAATELLATLDGASDGAVDKALGRQLSRDPSRMVRMSAQRALNVRAARLQRR